MHTIQIILNLIDDDVWKKIGGSFERSQTWLAMYHGLEVLKENQAEAERVKNSVDGTGYDCPAEPVDGEHYDTGEDTSPYVNISHAEKFQWACFILKWMDSNPEFHCYMKGSEKVQRYRPNMEEEVEKFLKGNISEEEKEKMLEEFGEVYAERWMAEISKEKNADFERYGSELIDYINTECSMTSFEESVRLSYIDKHVCDWNMSEFAEDLAPRLLPKLRTLIAGDPVRKIQSIPEKYGYSTHWVRPLIWKLTQLEKALEVHATS